MKSNQLATESLEIRQPMSSAIQGKAVHDRQLGIRDPYLFDESYEYAQAWIGEGV